MSNEGPTRMCEHGNDVHMLVTIPAHLSYTGEAREEYKPIDACIASIVHALNAHGIFTEASCCGHGKGPGSIILQDGRELLVHVASAPRETPEEP